jgi:hypothetical protein
MLLRIFIYILLLFLPLCLAVFLIVQNSSDIEDSHIEILSINLLETLCFDGKTCLDSGVWVKYLDLEGNSIITGHLFTLFPLKSGVFSNLDKVMIGDIITVYVDGNEYMYKVVEHKIVNSSDISIESQEFTHSLTLYTSDC